MAYINALTYQMIYEQPVLYELDSLKVPTLLIVGQLDRTIPGKELVSQQKLKLHGNFPILANKAKNIIKNCKLVVLPGVGHIPHIQTPQLFNSTILKFIN